MESQSDKKIKSMSGLGMTISASRVLEALLTVPEEDQRMQWELGVGMLQDAINQLKKEQGKE